MRPRRVKEHVTISNFTSLDELIKALTDLRETLPEGHEAELRMKGDDFFGRILTIVYSRPETDAEAEISAKYDKRH